MRASLPIRRLGDVFERRERRLVGRELSGLVLVVALCGAFAALRPTSATAPPGSSGPGSRTPTSQTRLSQAFGGLPLYFIENRGRLDPSIAYYLHGRQTSVYFAAGGLTFTLSRSPEPVASAHSLVAAAATSLLDRPPGGSERYALKLDFVGADPSVRPQGEDATPAVVSYFRGPTAQWNGGLKTFRGVRYDNLWPGIDLAYQGTESRLKYTFQVDPGADPRRIHLAYRGATSVQATADGQLEVQTPFGGFTDERPSAYQEIGGRRVPVPVAYELDPRRDGYGFRVGTYDPTLPLVLDPAVLLYAGFIGGERGERGLGIAVDAVGSAYVAGLACSADDTFPVTVGPDLTDNGDCDAFVAKVTPDGTGLVYAGYLGGDLFDQADAVAVDDAGNAYVVGSTASDESTFPVTVGPDLTFNEQPDNGDIVPEFDAFVAKVNADGTALLYAGYIGGNGLENVENIALDADGNAYVMGPTSSTEATFPVAVGPDLTFNGGSLFDDEGLDTFVAKVKADGTGLDYCGYIGGAGDDAGIVVDIFPPSIFITHGGIAVDSDGNAYVSGITESDETTFPDGDGFGSVPGLDQTINGGQDAFVAKVDADGTGLVYAGYIGGSDTDFALGMAVDQDGNAYVSGNTTSDETEGFPLIDGPDLTHNGGVDGFIAKVDPEGTALVYSGYIGGDRGDSANHLVVDGDGHAYVTGQANSDEATFPVIGGPDVTHNGNADAFVAKLKPKPDDPVVTNNFVYCGYIGGDDTDAGFDIALDPLGVAYVAGDAASTEASFTVTTGPDLTQNGHFDAFVAKVDTDSDSDGLPDSEEILVHGTDPFDADTDDDGLSDGFEVEFGTPPLDADGDDDGILDGQDVEWLQSVIAALPPSVFTDALFGTQVCRNLEPIDADPF